MNPIAAPAAENPVPDEIPATPVFLEENTADIAEEPVAESSVADDVIVAEELAAQEEETNGHVFEYEEALDEPRQFIAEPEADEESAFDGYISDTAPAYDFAADGGEDDGSFHVTVIDESKDSGVRNTLLMGATALMLTVILSATVYSIFNTALGVGAIDQGGLFAYVPEIVETPLDPEEPQIEDKKDDAGGGGGGGGDEQEPASKGQLPRMMQQPDIAPSAHMERLTNPTLTQRVGVQGPTIDQQIDPNQRYGLNTSRFEGISDGPGTGGGIGTGRGGGVGSGDGSGIGSGSGGGMGAGTGGGIGDGSGIGGNAPPPIKKGPTTKVQILAKPKAPYTDAARTNNIQGSVRLRITFLASGQIGSITPVTRLPYGLTENAIAAARQIRFKPAMRDGVPVTSTVTFEYGFQIY